MLPCSREKIAFSATLVALLAQSPSRSTKPSRLTRANYQAIITRPETPGKHPAVFLIGGSPLTVQFVAFRFHEIARKAFTSVCLLPHCRNPPTSKAIFDLFNRLRINHLAIGVTSALFISLPPQRRPNAMSHTSSGLNENQIHKSLIPMLRTWTLSIGWTVLLSAALAVLFAMICDGCSRVH